MSATSSIPNVDPGLIRLYQNEHTRLELARTEVIPVVDRLFQRFAISQTAHGVAGIPPSFHSGGGRPLLPIPRAFLSSKEVARVNGLEAGLCYVRTRTDMTKRGLVPVSLRPEAPYILHALAEGTPGRVPITNLGMARVALLSHGTQTGPSLPAEQVRSFLEEAIDNAIKSRAPPCVVAGWLMNTTIRLHPFSDSNEQVALLLYLLVSGNGLPGGFDWGVGEHWPMRRDALLADIGSARSATELDGGPAVSLLLRISADGAALMRIRLRFFCMALQELAGARSCGPENSALALALAIRRIATADVLAADVDLPYQLAVERLREAADQGLVRRVKLPASRRLPGPPKPAFTLDTAGSECVLAALARASA